MFRPIHHSVQLYTFVLDKSRSKVNRGLQKYVLLLSMFGTVGSNEAIRTAMVICCVSGGTWVPTGNYKTSHTIKAVGLLQFFLGGNK